MQVVNRVQLHVKQIADLAVRVGGVADAVELQIGIAQTGFSGLRGRTQATWRIQFRWSRPAPSCNQPCGRSATASRKYGDRVGSPPENCTDIWRRGLIEIALSSMVLISSHVSSCTKPTWFASMKQGSHIMLQRLVRSMVSTDAAAVLYRAGAVIVQLFVIVRTDVAAGEDIFQVLEELSVNRPSRLQSGRASGNPSPSGFCRRAPRWWL